MVGVLSNPAAKRFVTLQAGLVIIHSLLQLIVGPLLQRSRILRGLVHDVAGKAAHLPPLVTGGLQQTVVFPSGDPDDAVRPEPFLQEVRICAPKILPAPQAFVDADQMD